MRSLVIALQIGDRFLLSHGDIIKMLIEDKFVKNDQVPVNYFNSAEFYDTVQIVGIVATPNILSILNSGFTKENVLSLMFAVFGGMAKARRDLDENKNLYTANGLPKRNKDEAVIFAEHSKAIAQTAQFNAAIVKATQAVVTDEIGDEIQAKANEIMADLGFK